MAHGGEIPNSRALEFVIFCIENISLRLNIDARRVYDALVKAYRTCEELEIEYREAFLEERK